MKRFRLLQVTSPLVKIECGGIIIETKPINDTKKNPNFPEPVLSMDVVRGYDSSQISMILLLLYLPAAT